MLLFRCIVSVCALTIITESLGVELSGVSSRLTIYHSDNLPVLKSIPNESVDLIYIDPPFNTGHRQENRNLNSNNGERVGYEDVFDDYKGFLLPRLKEAHRVLKPNGSLFFHIDYREVHYCKIWLDEIFGRASFINEIIWVYDYGARSRKKWSPKHNTILWYAKNPNNYTFNYDKIDRIPYMAPWLVGSEKAGRGKTPTDVWWQTIVSPTSHEKTGYPTQKPRAILDRIIEVHSNIDDVVLDFFAGSGTTGESAYNMRRRAILIDANADAINVMRKRFKGMQDVSWVVSDEQNVERISAQ